jgi:hypothetical protein
MHILRDDSLEILSLLTERLSDFGDVSSLGAAYRPLTPCPEPGDQTVGGGRHSLTCHVGNGRSRPLGVNRSMLRLPASRTLEGVTFLIGISFGRATCVAPAIVLSTWSHIFSCQ